MILVAAGVVMVRCISDRWSCVPVALITFGVLFDLFVALGRSPNGTAVAAVSRYSMPNEMVVVALVSYAYVHVHPEWLRLAGAVAVAALLALTTASGLSSASTYHRDLQAGARLVVNRAQVPAAKQGCIALWGYFVDVGILPSGQDLAFVRQAQADHLASFGAPYATYQAEGLPRIPPCT